MAGRKAAEGAPKHAHRMMYVKQPALWDWAIRTSKAQGISLSDFIEKLMRDQVEREKLANTWD